MTAVNIAATVLQWLVEIYCLALIAFVIWLGLPSIYERLTERRQRRDVTRARSLEAPEAWKAEPADGWCGHDECNLAAARFAADFSPIFPHPDPADCALGGCLQCKTVIDTRRSIADPLAWDKALADEVKRGAA